MGKRHQPRTSLAAPVRMRIENDGEVRILTVCTLDASPTGCRLWTDTLKAGEIVELQYRATRSRFRVVWTDGQQAGLTSLDGKQLFRHLQRVLGHEDRYRMGKPLWQVSTADLSASPGSQK